MILNNDEFTELALKTLEETLESKLLRWTLSPLEKNLLIMGIARGMIAMQEECTKASKEADDLQYLPLTDAQRKTLQPDGWFDAYAHSD